MNPLILTLLQTALVCTAVPVEPVWTLRATMPESASPDLDTIIASAESAGDTLAAADGHLAVANALLARSLAPIASRELLGIPEDNDRAAAVHIRTRAQTQLDRVHAILDKLTDDADTDQDSVARRRKRLEAVSVFARAADYLWPESSDAAIADDDALRKTLLDLSLVMEDRRADIANTARLWRAYLFTRRGELSRALDLLPTALEPPVGDPSIALYTRLLRCRVFVQDKHSYPAAIALTVRLDERVVDWFHESEQAAAARRTVAFARRGFLRDWRESFTAAGESERAAWCDSAIEQLDTEHFSAPQSVELLPLAWAAPVIVELPALEPAEPVANADSGGVETAPHADEPDADDVIHRADTNGLDIGTNGA